MNNHNFINTKNIIIKNIFDFLDSIAPFDSCCSWDNSGLLVGNMTDQFTKGLVCLDVTDEIIEECIEKYCNLIISHHPVIFDKLSKITSDSLIYKLIQNKLNVICLHTNLDMAKNGVNFVLANVLNLTNLTGLNSNDNSAEFIALIGKLQAPMNSCNLAKFVKEKLRCQRVSYISCDKIVNTVAVCGGAGSSFFKQVASLKIDSYITSEIKHSIWLEAKQKNITLIDAGHFNTENVICDDLAQRLNNQFGKNKFQTAQNNKNIINFV